MKKICTITIISSFLFYGGEMFSQNIGINTDGSTGQTLLHTKNTAAATDNILRIENTIGTQKTGINILNSTTANSNWLFYIPASSTDLRLQFYTGTDAVTFLNNGNIGIGTTNPTSPVHLVTATNSNGFFQTDGTVQLSTWIGNGGFGNEGWIGTETAQFALSRITE